MKTFFRIQLVVLLFLVYNSLLFCQSRSDTSSQKSIKSKQKYSIYRSEYTLKEADSLVAKSEYSKAIWFYINLYPKYPKESIDRLRNIKSKVKDFSDLYKTSFRNFAMGDPEVSKMVGDSLAFDNDKFMIKVNSSKSILKEIEH
jgi:hypothetical protein